MGTEDMTPLDEFPTHKHLGQDEILYIEKGTVHVHLGDQERDLRARGTVFIPAYTWVNVKNAGTETVNMVFVFSAPGFENYMRCDSVLANEKVTPLSLEEQKGCAQEGHVIYKSGCRTCGVAVNHLSDNGLYSGAADDSDCYFCQFRG
jgi:hypothetical protein